LAGQSPVAESEQLGPEDAARERLVFALRRLEGIDTAQFAAVTGFAVEVLGGDALPQLVDGGFLALTSTRLKLTRPGLMVSDAIWPRLLRK
jgi:oxygen-independent coproporphyrinogen-3 oxidase